MPSRTKKMDVSKVDQPANPIGFVPGPETEEPDWKTVSLEDRSDRERFWSVIPEQNRELLKAGFADIRASLTRQTTDALRAGLFMNDNKGRVPHGRFLELCVPETGVDARTAERWMAAAESFKGKFDTVSVLNLTSLYVLSKRRKWLIDVRNEVIQGLEVGKRFSVAEIKKLCSDAKTAHYEKHGIVQKARTYPAAVSHDADRLFSLLKSHMAVLREVMSGGSWLEVFKALKERVLNENSAKPAS